MTRTDINRARDPDRMPERVRRRILREIRRAIQADLLRPPWVADGILLLLAIGSALYIHLAVFGP